MEPFSITCTTCQAKLKVRSAAAIGQILSCPKCESMVQVLPPPGWQPDGPTSPTGSGATVAKAAENTPASPPAEHAGSDYTAQASAAAAVPAQATVRPDVSPAAGFKSSLENIQQSIAQQPPVASGATAAAPPVDLPPLSADWASPAETLWRKVALGVVGGGTALVFLGVLVGYFLSRADTPSPAEPEQIAEPDQLAEQNSADQPASEDVATERPPVNNLGEAAAEPNSENADPAVAEKIAPAKTLLPPAIPDIESPTPPAEDSTPIVTLGEVPPRADKAATTEAPDAAKQVARNEPEKNSPATDSPPTSVKIDPAKLLADESLDSLLPGDAPSPDAALTKVAKEMTPEELEAVTKETENLPAEEPEVGGDPVVAARANPAQDFLVRRIPRESRTSQLNASEVLSTRFPQVKFSGVPLARFLGEISDLSALPITIDLAALTAAGISPDVPVSVKGSDLTLDEVLGQALSPEKLTHQSSASQVLVTTQAALAAPRTAKFSVDDLANDEEKLRELAAMLIKFVAPESWEFAGGAGKIQLENDRLALEQASPVMHDAIVFCERLRAARGLTLRSRLPADQLKLTAAQSRASKILSHPISCTFHEPMRLVEVLRYLEELSGAKIFVDWNSLDQADITPLDQIVCAWPERPLAVALENLLTPLGLDYRVLDERTLEVFAQADLPHKMTREFYPVRPLVAAGITSQVLLAGIHKMTGPEAWNDESTAIVFYDQPSGYLIVRHGRQVHSQVQHLLDELSRKLAAKK